MNREEVHDEAPSSDKYLKWNELHYLIDRIYDDFEQREADNKVKFYDKADENGMVSLMDIDEILDTN